MANAEHINVLYQGTHVWNTWRQEEINEDVKPDLSYTTLSGTNLRGANLSGVNLSEADLRGADLRRVDLSYAVLSKAHLSYATLSGANLREADLRGADLLMTDLSETDLSYATLNDSFLSEANLNAAKLRGTDLHEAILRSANLEQATLVETNFTNANLSGCSIYGVSAWNVILDGAIQKDLVITKTDEPIITVDNLEIAQFIYMLLHNEKLRSVIDTLATKSVLILGRFTDERKAILDAIREELRKRNYIPILFDFEKPASRDLTETVRTLAHLSRFIIADLTDAKSIPQELATIVPFLPSVAVMPIILSEQKPYAMWEHFPRYPWVLPLHEYESQDQLIAELSAKIIEPAEAKCEELRPK